MNDKHENIKSYVRDKCEASYQLGFNKAVKKCKSSFLKGLLTGTVFSTTVIGIYLFLASQF